MKDDIELVRGSGNVYRDFGRANPGLEQARALIAARIIRNLDARKLSTRDAEKVTGVSHSEFSRIRNARLRRFTLDRMIAILGKLDADVEVQVSFKTLRHGSPIVSQVAEGEKEGIHSRKSGADDEVATGNR
jgi:predicted XRE-type DNA-binding protein